MRSWSGIIAVFIISCVIFPITGMTGERARDLGIPFEGTPGPLNAITDVAGVEVGHTTLIFEEATPGGKKKAVRTGLSVVFPLGKHTDARVPAAWFSLNGNGEMTGTTWITESGYLEGPVITTNTHSVGIVRDALVEWGQMHFPGTEAYSLPVVAETWDGFLNDINGFHIRKKHVFQALDGAKNGPVTEGNVGGGTGMVAYRFKGGIGTASRKLDKSENGFTVGVFVQANFGRRKQLIIAGIPVGREIPDLMPEISRKRRKDGSIIVIVATDAPLLPHQLKRLAKRVALGLGRLGSIATNSSGDIFIAFSTAVPRVNSAGFEVWESVPNGRLDAIFSATIQAVEEAVVNAMVAAETMTGASGNKVYAIPHERLKSLLMKYNRKRN